MGGLRKKLTEKANGSLVYKSRKISEDSGARKELVTRRTKLNFVRKKKEMQNARKADRKD